MSDETFTIQFYSEEARKQFFDKYGQSITKDSDRSQFFLKAMGRGDKFYEADAFLSMLRSLWGITKAYDFLTQKPHEEKLLSIIEQVVEKGHADRDFLEKYGGLKELERIETLTF